MRKLFWMFAGMAVCAAALGEEAATRPGGEGEHRRDAHATTLKLPFTVSKETTGIVKPLREDGTPDYVAAMNEKYGKGVTPENNAFVGWLKVVGTGEDVLSVKDREKYLAACGASESEGMKWASYQQVLKGHRLGEARFTELMFDDHEAGRRLWTEDDYPIVAEFLKKNEGYLETVKGAIGRPRYWVPLEEGTLVADLPSLAKMRDRCNALAARATLRARAGDFDGFLSDVMAIKRLAEHLSSGGERIDRLVGWSMNDQSNRVIGAVAGSGNLPVGQCVRLWEKVRGFAPVPEAWDTVDIGERWMALRAVSLVATGRTKDLLLEESTPWNDQWNRIWEGFEVKDVDWDGVMKRVNAAMNERVKGLKNATLDDLKGLDKDLDAAKAGAGTVFEKSAGEAGDAYAARVGDAIAAVLGVGIGRAEELRRQTVMQDEMGRALVAAAGYKADKGKWPEKLGELVPGYLKAVPRDIYSEGGKEEVGYSWSGDGAVVSSIGAAGSNGRHQAIEVGAR